MREARRSRVAPFGDRERQISQWWVRLSQSKDAGGRSQEREFNAMPITMRVKLSRLKTALSEIESRVAKHRFDG